MAISHQKLVVESTQYILNWYDGFATATDLPGNLKMGTVSKLMNEIKLRRQATL
jgi:hypothetical protein